MTWLVVAPVRLYQLLVRPLLPPGVCRFDPSCSDYFIQAVRKYGPLCGALKGGWRVCRCNPLGGHGHDPP